VGHYKLACRAGKLGVPHVEFPLGLAIGTILSITPPADKQTKTEPVAKQLKMVPMANPSGNLTSGTPGSQKFSQSTT
jgi:hypothetical protein